jgi:hypothetical protein
MADKYYRYSVEGTLSLQDAARAVGESGGVIVRVDNRGGRTDVTVAGHGDREIVMESPLGSPVEIREDEVLEFGAS